MLLTDGCIDIGFTLKSWSKLSLENDTLNQSACMYHGKCSSVSFPLHLHPSLVQ